MADRQPVLIIIGGPNGCGKSTFARQASGTELLLGATPTNPDELTQRIRSQMPRLSALAANLVAAEQAEKAVWRAIAEGFSVAIETVLSTSKYLPIVQAARSRGYQTRLIFVAVADVKTAVGRVAARKAAGGHGVPAAKIRARWKRAHDNLIPFAAAVDDVLIFSNQPQVPMLVAERKGVPGSIVLRDRNALPDVTRVLERGAS